MLATSTRLVGKCVTGAVAGFLAAALATSLLAAQATTAPDAATNPQSPEAKAVPDAPPGSEQVFASYEGQMVSAVEIAGQPDLNPDQFTSIMAQKPGEPFSAAKVLQTAAALKAAGKFKEVRVDVEPEANGERVTFVLEPAVWFGTYRFPGAQRFAYSQLIQVSNYPVQKPFNAAEVERDGKSLESFLQQEGFFEAQVQTQVHVDAPHALANVDFHVTLSRQAKFGAIVMQGGTPQQQADLKRREGKLWTRLRGAAIRPGKTFHHATLTRATRYLQSRLESQGYLSAQVKLVGAEYHADTNRADIHFSIKPGVKTQVKITGAHLWSWTRKDLLPMYQGVGVDEETVQEGRQALISHFEKRGFFDVKVDAHLDSSPAGDTVIYQIDRQKRHKVTAVRIEGNKQLPDSRLMPSVAVGKKRLFSPGNFSSDLVRTSVKNLTGIYQAEGFSDVKVTSAVTRDSGNVQVTFQVAEGPRNVVSSVSIEGAHTFPESEFAPQGLKVRAGQPYSQAHVQEDRSTILANYLRAGYLNVSFRETASVVSKEDPHRINVVYIIHEGPRVMTGQVITLGRVHTVPRLINNDTSQLRPEHPLTESDLLTTGSKLYEHTGVFDWAEVDPKRTITTQTSEDVLVKVHEADRNEFQYGFGFEVIERGGNIPSGTAALPNLPPIGLPANFSTAEATFYGPRGTAQYTRNNIRGRGESFSITAFAGRLDQRGAMYYIIPNFRWSPWRATVNGSIERNEENPIFSSQVLTASLQFQRPVDRAKKNIVFLRYSYSKTDLTRILLAQLVPPEDQHIKLSTLAGNFTRDTRDNPIDAHRGFLGSLELNFNTSALGSNVDFAKLTGQAAFYKEKIHHIVWANSVRIGLAEPFNNSFVPLSEAFFSGGGNSLRGIPLDSAGPQRSITICPNGETTCNNQYPFPTGGNELLILNSEARIPLSLIMRNLGIVGFYDGGGVFPYVGFHDFGPEYSNNVGFGLRYATPVGPIRLDVGKNLNPISNTVSQYYSWQFFFSIGQAF